MMIEITAPALETSGERVARWDRFDAASERAWRELLRDLTALANSGGGSVVLPAQLSDADVLQHLARYTSSSFDDIEVRPVEQADVPTVRIAVGPAIYPLGLTLPPSDAQLPTTAGQESPAAGFFTWRDGHSAPATTADMRAFVERLLRRVRRRWLRAIRRVLAAPLDAGAKPAAARPAVLRPKERERLILQPVRIVTDAEAPALQPQDIERLYPWRQKDLLRELNHRLGRRVLNSYDIQAIRRQHRLDERPEFVFNLPGAGRRYSPAVADWIMAEYGRDPEFFHNARAADQIAMKLRRQKPR